MFCTKCLQEIARGLGADDYTVLGVLSKHPLPHSELRQQTALSVYHLRAALNRLAGARLIMLDFERRYHLSPNGEQLRALAQRGIVK